MTTPRALKWLLDDLENEARVAGIIAELHRLGDDGLKKDENVACIYERFAGRIRQILTVYRSKGEC